MHYVISDIHGNLRRFHSILEQIHLQPEDHLYVLGDISDRHPHGMEILQELRDMPNCSILLGNHEYMMLDALGRPYQNAEKWDGREKAKRMAHWYRNGGAVTHQAWQKLPKEKREDVLDFLQSLPVSMDVEVSGHHFEMVHAAPPELYQPDSVVWKDLPYFCVWNRDALFQVPPPEDKVILFGHTPTRHFQDADPLCIWEGHNLLGIDCGSGYPDPPVPGHMKGRLGCIRLEDMQTWYSQEALEPTPEPEPEAEAEKEMETATMATVESPTAAPPVQEKEHWFTRILKHLPGRKKPEDPKN